MSEPGTQTWRGRFAWLRQGLGGAAPRHDAAALETARMTPADLRSDIAFGAASLPTPAERLLGTAHRTPANHFFRAILAAGALHMAALGSAAIRADLPAPPSLSEPPVAELVFAPPPVAEPVAEPEPAREPSAPGLPAAGLSTTEPLPPDEAFAAQPAAEMPPEPAPPDEPAPEPPVADIRLPVPPIPVASKPAPRTIAARLAAPPTRLTAAPQARAGTDTPAAPAPREAAASSRLNAEAMASLESRIRGAVQAAVHFPPAAQMMGLAGRAQVFLEYRAGVVGSLTLARSAGTPLFDEAALSAVRSAAYPKPPPEIGDRLLRLLVWVEFKHQG